MKSNLPLVISVILALFRISSSTSPAAEAPAPNTNYFRDDFNTLDPTIWSTEITTPTVSGGILKFALLPASPPIKPTPGRRSSTSRGNSPPAHSPSATP